MEEKLPVAYIMAWQFKVQLPHTIRTKTKTNDNDQSYINRSPEGNKRENNRGGSQ